MNVVEGASGDACEILTGFGEALLSIAVSAAGCPSQDNSSFGILTLAAFAIASPLRMRYSFASPQGWRRGRSLKISIQQSALSSQPCSERDLDRSTPGCAARS